MSPPRSSPLSPGASAAQGSAAAGENGRPAAGVDPDLVEAAALGSPVPFEQAIVELETLVQQMESGELSLEASLAAYKRGAALVGVCRQALADVQQQVKVLEGDLLKPFDAEPREGE